MVSKMPEHAANTLTDDSLMITPKGQFNVIIIYQALHVFVGFIVLYILLKLNFTISIHSFLILFIGTVEHRCDHLGSYVEWNNFDFLEINKYITSFIT